MWLMEKAKGTLSCFDRLVLFGTFGDICYPQAMDRVIAQRGIKRIDYEKRFANDLRLKMVAQVKAVAEQETIAIEHVYNDQRKESLVEKKRLARGDHPGIVCILSAMESCRCFKVTKDQKSGYLQLSWRPGKCLHYYVYFIDEDYGLCYLRIPTWAPFRLQFYFNGHDWLQRQMQKNGIGFEKADNCFVRVDDFEKAQELVWQFDASALHKRLDQLAARFVYAAGQWGLNLHWSVYQAEWATDMVFDEGVLPEFYQQIIRTAMMEVQCHDIYRFLGKRLTEASAREVSDRLQTLVQGTRIKHTLGPTCIKMYDKQQRVLRIETSTSDISVFKHRREVNHRNGTREMKYAPVKKTIYSLGALAEQMQACNKRYLAFIAQLPDQTGGKHNMDKITRSQRDDKDRSFRGVNFFQTNDLTFLLALLNPRNLIAGITNRRLQELIPSFSSSKIGRMLKRFHVLKLLKRVAGTYRYYLTELGKRTLVAALQLKNRIIIPAMNGNVA